MLWAVIKAARRVEVNICHFCLNNVYVTMNRKKKPLLSQPGLVARSESHPSGMRTVGRWTLVPATFFRWDWSWNHFYNHALPMTDSSRSNVGYWRKEVHLVLVNHLGSLPRNSVVRLTDSLAMTIDVDWDIKPHIKQTDLLSQPMWKGYLSQLNSKDSGQPVCSHARAITVCWQNMGN